MNSVDWVGQVDLVNLTDLVSLVLFFECLTLAAIEIGAMGSNGRKLCHNILNEGPSISEL